MNCRPPVTINFSDLTGVVESFRLGGDFVESERVLVRDL